jgi:hypothetical protein
MSCILFVRTCTVTERDSVFFFCFWFFSWISFPPTPEYPIRTVSNFLENLRRYSQVKVHHRYQRHRWQILPLVSLVLLPPVSTIPAAILPPVSTTCQQHRWQTMGTISGCRQLKVNLKAKIYKYVNSTIQRCPNKII